MRIFPASCCLARTGTPESSELSQVGLPGNIIGRALYWVTKERWQKALAEASMELIWWKYSARVANDLQAGAATQWQWVSHYVRNISQSSGQCSPRRFVHTLEARLRSVGSISLPGS